MDKGIRLGWLGGGTCFAGCCGHVDGGVVVVCGGAAIDFSVCLVGIGTKRSAAFARRSLMT
jgi:hypothetical protein